MTMTRETVHHPSTVVNTPTTKLHHTDPKPRLSRPATDTMGATSCLTDIGRNRQSMSVTPGACAPSEASAMLSKLPASRARVGHPRRHPAVPDMVGGSAHGTREPG